MGKLVKYDNRVLVVGGEGTAKVEEMIPRSRQLYSFVQLSWVDHPMSPVNDMNAIKGFTALSLDKSLFIFGTSDQGGNAPKRGGDIVLEWNGTSWSSLADKLCAKRMYHTTVVYGEIYHMGRLYLNGTEWNR